MQLFAERRRLRSQPLHALWVGACHQAGGLWPRHKMDCAKRTPIAQPHPQRVVFVAQILIENRSCGGPANARFVVRSLSSDKKGPRSTFQLALSALGEGVRSLNGSE